MKTKEELNAIKEEVKILNEKLAGLTEEELAEVTGGMKVVVEEKEELSWWETIINFFFKTKN